MTDQHIQKIIDELCAMEPSFGEHIDEVRAIVSQMYANQPDVEVDKAFVDKTRDALLEHITAGPSPRASIWHRLRLVTVGVSSMAAIVCGVMMRNWYGRSIVDPAGEQAGDRRDSVDAGRVTDDRQALPSDDADSGWGGLLRPTGGAPNMKTSIAQRTASVDMAMPESMLMADTSETIGFRIGGAQDMGLVRESILNGYLPDVAAITYDGLFGDYHFAQPDGECEQMFCPLVDASVVDGETYVQISLGSHIREEDYERPPTDFVFVVDRSGSMGSSLTQPYDELIDDDVDRCDDDDIYFVPAARCISSRDEREYRQRYDDLAQQTKMELANDALAGLVQQLQPDDRVGIVYYDDIASVAHPLKDVSRIDMDALVSHIRDVRENGGTNMEAGLRDGIALYDTIDTPTKKTTTRQQRIVFITDAMPNIGIDDPDGFDTIIADAVAGGIQFSYIGVGVDFAQDFVAHLSSHPGSNYFFINDARQLQQRLIQEFDYNFFPMVYDVELRVDEPSMIDEVYGVDELRDGRVLSIDTLFPSPPRDGGHRGSIVLLKLRGELTEDLTCSASYTTLDGASHEAREILVAEEIDDSPTIRKAVWLVRYADALRNSIKNNTTRELRDIQSTIETYADVIGTEDAKMRSQEYLVISAAIDLIDDQRRSVDDDSDRAADRRDGDFWQE